ncbi:MAG: T9SS type A sorting domain-containing protein, partial [Chitinophagales bacterium]
PYKYEWSPAIYLDTLFRDHPFAILHSTIDYVLTVTDANQISVSDTIHVTVKPVPEVRAGFDRFISFGSNATLASPSPASEGTAPYLYSWSPSIYLNQSHIAQPVSTPLSNITYTLTATDAAGCVGSDDVTLMMSIPATGTAGLFGMLAGDSIITLNPVFVPAWVGSGKFISASVTSDDTIVVRSSLDSAAIADLASAISQVKEMPGANISSVLGGQSLTSGSYYINGNSTLNSTLTLNGNSESFFIINISNSLTVNGGGITLIGVSRSQVYFRVGGNLRITGTAFLPCNFLVEKNISGGIINGASLLTLGKINITDADVKANVYAAGLTAVSRTDAGEFFGFNSSNVSYVSQIYPSHLSDHNVRLHMPQLNARIVRWPAGGHAKDWNINDGWFLDPDEVKDSSQYIYSPNISCVAVTPNEAAANLKLPVDRLLDLRFCLGGSDAKMLMCLNMFTNKKFQEDVLKHAVDLGMNFPYIELGNEFYLKGGTCPWVQPEDYAAEASSWLNTIHGNPAFAGIKVGFDGSSWTTEDGITDDDCRRKTWNAGVLPNLTGTKPGDAITFHIYPKTGIAASKIPNVVLEDIPTMFARAFKAIDNFSNNELKTVADYPDLDVWVTEYNLTDKSFIIAGSWAHAMYLSILTMRLLEFPQVKMALCQTFANDAGRGLFFTDARGYKFGSKWATIDSLTETQPWAFTAGGLCVKMITDAMRFSTSAAMLSFPHAPLIPNSEYPVLYGWTFDKDLGDKQSVILNLSDQPQQIDVRALQPANAFEQVSCKNPLLFFTGKVYWNQPYNNFYKAVDYNYNNGTETPANFDSISAKIPAGTTTIFLPPYSITRLYALNQNTVWFRKSGPKVCAPDNNDYDTAHASTAINIYASGGAYYDWSVMESEPSTSSSISISPLAPLSNGILKVFDPEGNLLGTKNNISITHNTLPAVSVTPSSFSNKTAASFTATASGAAAYNWTPSFGASGILGNTITINPPYSRNYYVIGTAGNKCSKIEKISTNISPAITIISAGGELDRRFVPAILFVCRGNMISLTADGAADAYLWSSSDGSVNGSGVSITFTPSKDVLITVRATDQLNQATSYSSVYVSLRPEVITDQEDYYYCANQFLKLHGELNKESVNTTYAWDDLQPGTKLYEKRNFTKPVAENVFNSSYNSVFFNAPAGDYVMQFKAQDADYLNCPAVENDYFFKVHLNNPPSIIPPANLCVIRGGTVTLTASGGDHDYTWDGPGLQKSIGASVQVSPEVTSVYKVTTSNNMCCVSASVTVNVENVTAECDGSIYCYGCPGKQVSVSPFDAENYTYQWIENGVAISGATGESYSIMLALNETIKESVVQCAIAKNDGACAPGITNEVRVSVFQNCHYERGESYASENSNDAQSISVSPNPASENFTIIFSEENSDDDIAMLEVYDLMGKLFRKDRLNLTDGKYSGNFSQSFPDGIYVVRICTSRSCIATRLVITD